MKAWITKYALTEGIREVLATQHENGMISFSDRYGADDWYAHGNDWHKTREAALARAEEMRVAKIASLKERIAKLETMKFKVTP